MCVCITVQGLHEQRCSIQQIVAALFILFIMYNKLERERKREKKPEQVQKIELIFKKNEVNCRRTKKDKHNMRTFLINNALTLNGLPYDSHLNYKEKRDMNANELWFLTLNTIYKAENVIDKYKHSFTYRAHTNTHTKKCVIYRMCCAK